MAPTADSVAIGKIHTSVAVIQSEVTNLTHSVAVLNKVLIGKGNVKDSLVVRFSEMEGNIERFKKSRRSFWPRCQWLITSAIAVAAIIVLFLKS